MADPGHGTVRLPDSRALGYAAFGDPAGRPVLYFHGFPGSRLEAALGHDLACALAVRLIGVERPGYGTSDPKPGRTLEEWPADVAALADALGLERFGVLGVSGGGPYALACASALEGRVGPTAVVGGLAPLGSAGGTRGMAAFNRAGLWIAGRTPWLLGPIAWLVVQAARRPEWVLRHLDRVVSEADRTALADTDLRDTLARSFREGVSRGPQGLVSDARIYARPWGASLAEIGGPVGIWHGERDVIVPPTMGRALADAIPGARRTFHPEEGHFSIVRREMRTVLAFAAG